MTEPHLPLTDEDLSAYLDNEVTPEVRARIEADPQALGQVQDLVAARDAVAASRPAPLPSHVVDAMVARALDSFDSSGAASSEQPDSAPLAPPSSIARARRGRASRSATWMVAAAVVALVAIGSGLIWSGVQSTESSDVAGSADTAATEAERQAARQDPDSDSDNAEAFFDGAPPTSVEPAEVTDLGSAETPAELRRSLAEGFPADSGPVSSPAAEASDGGAAGEEPITIGQVDSCAQQLGVRHGTGNDVTDVGTATVDGERYLVYDLELAEPHDAGDHLVAVVEIGHGCAPFITFYR